MTSIVFIKKWYLFLFISFTLQSCLTVKNSKLRPSEPYRFELPGKLELFSEGPVKMMNKDFLPASFRLEFKDKVIYIDPLKIENAKPADFILITHDHMDHFSREDIRKIATSNTFVICPVKVAKKIKNYKVQVMKPGDHLKLQDFEVEAVPAYNTKPVFLWIKGHPKKAEYLGYIFTINGKKIYHGGDTGIIPEMEGFPPVDIALIPAGGDKLTMNIEEAAKMVNSLKPEYVIPMHYEAGHGYGKEFEKLIYPGIKVVLFEN
jgi:L-ascorbate metabolism protein UlaG (beta-lactamase superfamily)